jgi:hypothetical protein
MLLMSYFSVVDAKGGEVLGTKAMKIISNTMFRYQSNENYIKHQTPPNFNFQIFDRASGFGSLV